MLEVEMCQVAIVGPPFSGTTTISDSLKPDYLSRTAAANGNGEYTYLVTGEAWDYYNEIAQVIYAVFGSDTIQISSNSLERVREILRATSVPKKIIERIKSLYADVELNNEMDLYNFFDLQILSEIASKSQQSDPGLLRLLFQRDLLRIQLRLEGWRHGRYQRNHHDNGVVLITVGCLWTILNYRNHFEEMRDILGPTLAFGGRSATATYPHMQIICGTLLKSNSVDPKMFYDGRRLDTPEETLLYYNWLWKIADCLESFDPGVIRLHSYETIDQRMKIVEDVLTNLLFDDPRISGVTPLH